MSRWSAPQLLPLSRVSGSAGGNYVKYTEKQTFHYSPPATNASVVLRGVS